MRFSILIPAYNHLDKVMICLNSLQALATTPHEYIVQDDCSPAVNFVACVPQCVASTRRNMYNLGFPANVNAAADRANGDILFIVNQDVYGVPEFSLGWDVALLDAFDNPEIGAVGARLLFPDGTLQSAGGAFDAKCQPYHRCIGYSNLRYPEINTPQDVAWVTGAALAVRRDLWQRVGGFDVIYGRGYFEDVELCMRVRELGFRVWYEPRTTLIHSVGSTGGNPMFPQNARVFKSRWVDTGKIHPTSPAIYVNYW